MQKVFTKRMSDFMNSEQGKAAKQALISMENDDRYNTQPVYSPNTELYPDNLKSFVQTHMDFLAANPKVDPVMYLSNLRLMTRIK